MGFTYILSSLQCLLLSTLSAQPEIQHCQLSNTDWSALPASTGLSHEITDKLQTSDKCNSQCFKMSWKKRASSVSGLTWV